MLGSMFNYTPSVTQGGVSSALPQQLASLPTQAPRTAQQQAFNLPAYMRQNTSQGQWNEMNVANQNRYRAGLAKGQSDMGRNMASQNANQAFGAMQAGTNAANQYYDTMNSAIQGDRANQANWFTGLSNLQQQRNQTYGPMLGSLFGF